MPPFQSFPSIEDYVAAEWVEDPWGLLRPRGGIKGEVSVSLGDELAYCTSNVYVNDGYARLASYLALGGGSSSIPAYIGIGNGNGTVAGAAISASGSDHALAFELLRVAITSSSVQSTYTARFACVVSNTALQRQLYEVGLFDSAGDNGTATGTQTGASALVDTSKAWTVNQWQNWTLYITNAADGDAVKKVTIASNTATTLTLSSALTTAPVAGTTTYTIGGVDGATPTNKWLFARAPINVLKGNQPMNVVWTLTFPAA